MYCSDYYFLIKKLFTGDLYASREDITGHWMERVIIADSLSVRPCNMTMRSFVLEENHTCK